MQQTEEMSLIAGKPSMETGMAEGEKEMFGRPITDITTAAWTGTMRNPKHGQWML
jgi:hypothetical protein